MRKGFIKEVLPGKIAKGEGNKTEKEGSTAGLPSQAHS